MLKTKASILVFAINFRVLGTEVSPYREHLKCTHFHFKEG